MAKTLEERVQRLEDIAEIRKMFSAHIYLNATGREFEHSFSQERNDVRFELERMGISDGPQNVRQRVSNLPPGAPTGADPGGGPGGGNAHYQCSYIIEVAEDGQTAQATCLSPGHVTGNGNFLLPMWTFARYGINFVKENGKWKYWRQHMFTVFNSFYYTKSWVQRSIDRALQPAGAQSNDTMPRNVDRNTSIDAPYALNAPPRLVPHLPVPYTTFDETMSYVPPPAPRDT